MDQSNKAQHPVKSVHKTFDITEALQELDGAGVTELAEYTGITKSSVHNYLSTLRERGYVVKQGNEYHVAIKFLGLGAFARHRQNVYEVAKPEVASLAQETGELANLLVEEHGKGIYILREVGSQAVSVDKYTGGQVHLHNTALGKAILAHMPEERVKSILDRHGMVRSTENTITSQSKLFDELEQIRKTGVAFDRQERLKGLRCVAAPVLRNDEYIEAAISVSGPLSRMQQERFEEEIPELLRSAVNIIELNIAYG
ncbi:IclR family transcriptional regulator [Haladaptatus pallidirubidus]|uniref:IclR family transcriptional regulator n=1 Tax=Haladaptatus pallidirubidus TaxID=1008152 RepID=A0AAV3UQ54_9EURY|nr:IclR family transcriptional regulator [Haladaptatus pallidirubidus]